jgi:uncharacterized UBP type Zn finger protein
MTVDTTFSQLVDMGIDPTIAREAAIRYQDNADAAVDWCFGSGSQVRAKRRRRGMQP